MRACVRANSAEWSNPNPNPSPNPITLTLTLTLALTLTLTPTLSLSLTLSLTLTNSAERRGMGPRACAKKGADRAATVAPSRAATVGAFGLSAAARRLRPSAQGQATDEISACGRLAALGGVLGQLAPEQLPGICMHMYVHVHVHVHVTCPCHMSMSMSMSMLCMCKHMV